MKPWSNWGGGGRDYQGEGKRGWEVKFPRCGSNQEIYDFNIDIKKKTQNYKGHFHLSELAG